jgi:hypothetical protein
VLAEALGTMAGVDVEPAPFREGWATGAAEAPALPVAARNEDEADAEVIDFDACAFALVVGWVSVIVTVTGLAVTVTVMKPVGVEVVFADDVVA